MTALLELKNLGVTYRTGGGDVPAVRGVDLRLDAGGTLGVAGESGSGKSTVAMSVLRLLPRSAKITGEVLLDGEDVNAMRWGRLRAVRWAEASVVFQGAMHALNPVRRVGEQIAEPIRLHAPEGAARSEAQVQARVTELLEQVDLPRSRASAYPHELSGGQKQRVMIAMGPGRANPPAGHRRRTHHRTRRHRAGPGAVRAVETRRRTRHRAGHDQPRPVRARRHLRTHRGDVRRRTRRGTAQRRADVLAAARTQQSARRRVPDGRRPGLALRPGHRDAAAAGTGGTRRRGRCAAARRRGPARHVP
ncbi:nickel import ATP-binding protein NikD [Streptomyces sp. AA4]|nr:ATP-binding cassette domain-containing protein [Streptomyces sp. AA4]EFL08166.1 nickel import ATP-binding protein NikD [Streptomyces sp. AA4]